MQRRSLCISDIENLLRVLTTKTVTLAGAYHYIMGGRKVG